MAAIRVPPGRAGRLWLRRRLDTATRGADLLEQKLRALLEEQRRLTARCEVTGQDWQQRAREAQTWLLRAVLVGGQRSLRLATTNEPATVTVTWAVSMGVRYPAEALCSFPTRQRSSATLFASAALVQAAAAHRAALEAAARHAAARTAVKAINTEVTTTRQRVRALRRHWIPRLQDAHARIDLDLEEQEHSDGVRLRWAADTGAQWRTDG